jgi:hypothetical protein
VSKERRRETDEKTAASPCIGLGRDKPANG